jgi:hypothetical protein
MSMTSPGPAHHAFSCVEYEPPSSLAECGSRGHRGDAFLDGAGELAGSLWTFVRSDPASISRLNTPGQWSTWQAAEPSVAGRARSVDASAGERRSLRRRREISF